MLGIAGSSLVLAGFSDDESESILDGSSSDMDSASLTSMTQTSFSSRAKALCFGEALVSDVSKVSLTGSLSVAGIC